MSAQRKSVAWQVWQQAIWCGLVWGCAALTLANGPPLSGSAYDTPPSSTRPSQVRSVPSAENRSPAPQTTPRAARSTPPTQTTQTPVAFGPRLAATETWSEQAPWADEQELIIYDLPDDASLMDEPRMRGPRMGAPRLHEPLIPGSSPEAISGLRSEAISDPAADQMLDLSVTLEPEPLFRRGPGWLFGPTNGRDRGFGQPLQRESWINRPLSVDFFSGGVFAGDLLRNRVEAGAGPLIGTRLGWDLGHFYGVDMRLATAEFGIYDANSQPLGDADLLLWDINWYYYPWGDSKWRPYFSAGLGAANYKFTDDLNSRVNQTTFSVPFGGGLKYRHNNRVVLRADLLDNVTFDSGHQVNTVHNISLTAGIEFRLGGGTGRTYWPWNPSRGWR